MANHTYNFFKPYFLSLVALLTGVLYATAQDRTVLAHLVTDAAKADGALVRLDTKTSTRYTKLGTLTGTVGFFYGDKHYISLLPTTGEDADMQDVSYSITNLHSLESVEYKTEYTDYMAPLSGIFHPIDSAVYLCYRDRETNLYIWSAIECDLDKNTLKLVSPENEISRPYYALCSTPDGDIYGFSNDAALYRIDKNTGEGEKLFQTGAVGKELQSAWYDEENDMIYRAVSSSIGVTIYSYSLSDKREAFVKIYTSVAAIVAMMPEVESLVDDVPAAVKNLSVVLEDDMISGTIYFTAPKVDINGNELTGSLSHILMIDNVAIDTIEALPGERCQYEYVFSRGERVVTVFANNEKGRGEKCDYGFFAGYDLPKSPKRIYVSTEFPYVRISWSVPEGIHGKVVDVENLRYRVVRYPDGVLVADTAAVQVVDSLASIPGNYYYGVTAYLPDYETSESLSPSFYYDCAIEVPYVRNEWDSGALNSFMIEDANGDGATWGCMETTAGRMTMRYLYSSVHDADDYLYFPKMYFESNTYYEATIYMRAGSDKYDEYFSVGIASSDDMKQKNDFITGERCIGKQSKPYKAGFSVEQDGIYRLYVHCVSPVNQHLLYIDSISVIVSERRNVPAGVSDMKLSPDVTTPHIVTIDFIAPTRCVDGTPLDELESISVYRNDELLYTFERPALGMALSYRDSVGIIDNYTYKVVAANACGVGEEVSQDVVRGVAAFPYSHNFVEGLGYFTVCDNNADGVTWHYYEERFMGCMRYMSSEVNAADDWLISPPIYLSDSIRYQIEYSCCAGLSIYPESMRVLLGRTPLPNAMSVVVDELQDFTFINDTCIVAPFEVSLSGNYYLAFQANSEADRYAVLLREMAIGKYNPMSVAAVAVEQSRVWGADGCIKIQSCNNAVVEVFDIAGNKVATIVTTSTPCIYPVSRGIYFVRCGYSTHKVVVR